MLVVVVVGSAFLQGGGGNAGVGGRRKCILALGWWVVAMIVGSAFLHGGGNAGRWCWQSEPAQHHYPFHCHTSKLCFNYNAQQ